MRCTNLVAAILELAGPIVAGGLVVQLGPLPLAERILQGGLHGVHVQQQLCLVILIQPLQMLRLGHFCGHCYQLPPVQALELNIQCMQKTLEQPL